MPTINSNTQITTIDLLRHGECEGGEIFRGSTDSALTQKGKQQMLASINSRGDNPSWDNIVSSPLQRCRLIASELAETAVLPVNALHGFAEIDFGDWEGRLTSEVASEHPRQIQKFWTDPATHTPPNGESLVDFQKRVQHVWQLLLKEHRGQHTLLVSHGGVIRIILASVLQMPLRPLSFLAVPHGCLSQIKIFHHAGYDDWPQLIFHNRG